MEEYNGLMHMDDKVNVGSKAPDFTLPDTELKPRRLRDFLDKNVVLAFYPGAFTSVCTKEMCTFRDSIAKLNDLKAQVVGISVDDPFSNKGFAERNMLNFPLLSDYNREVVGIYGVAAEDFAGLKGYTAAKRSIFIVDRERTVRYVWISEDPRMEPNYEEIERVLEEIG
jgi:peroxiredoxin